MKLSIILTVYNKEQYLRRVLDSLLGQDNADLCEYEILAVNDGSSDKSEDILKEYAEKYNKIKIVNQGNQGLSMARNNGLDIADGDYVWFVDADDILSSHSVKLISDAMVSTPDVIPIYAQFKGDDRVHNRIRTDVKTGKEVLLDRWSHCGVFWIFRKQFLIDNNLRFFPGIYHEDSEFTPRMLYAAKSVIVIPEILYIVDCDPNSITQIPRPKRAIDCLTVAEHLYDFEMQHNERDTAIGRVFNYNISVIINNGLDVIIKNSSAEQRNFNAALKSKKKLLNALAIAPMLKFRVEALLFRLFSGNYVGVYRFMKLFG